MQTNENEVVAASVVYMSNVSTDAPMPLETVHDRRQVHHFSTVRRLNGQPFPTGVRRAQDAQALDSAPCC